MMSANAYAHETIAVYRRVGDSLEMHFYRDGECYFIWPDGHYQFGAKDVTFDQIEKWLLTENGLGFIRVES